MKHSPIPVDLVYQRKSNDSVMIIQSISSTTTPVNMILLPLESTIYSQFETTMTQCPIYSYDLYRDEGSNNLYDVNSHIEIKNKQRNGNPDVLDNWMPSPPEL